MSPDERVRHRDRRDDRRLIRRRSVGGGTEVLHPTDATDDQPVTRPDVSAYLLLEDLPPRRACAFRG
jgi:hypothetical protein